MHGHRRSTVKRNWWLQFVVLCPRGFLKLYFVLCDGRVIRVGWYVCTQPPAPSFLFDMSWKEWFGTRGWW